MDPHPISPIHLMLILAYINKGSSSVLATSTIPIATGILSISYKFPSMSGVLVSCLLFCIIAASYFRIGYGQTTFNVLDYDAAGDGQRDDSEVIN